MKLQRLTYFFIMLNFAVAACAAPSLARGYRDTPIVRGDAPTLTATTWGYQPGYPNNTYPLRQETLASDTRLAPDTSPPPADWRKPKPLAEEIAEEMLAAPRSRTSFDAGLQFSDYEYEEPDVMTTSGAKYGFTVSGTAMVAGNWFIKVDGRFAFGDVDYTSNGSGDKKDNDDRLIEVRGLIGGDLVSGRWVIVPYFGLGYRNLYNDLRGTTTTGAVGYRRDSNYLYLPLGIEPRYQMTPNSRLSMVFEYDPLIRGWQHSYLTDAGLGDPDITNRQKSGYGLRGEIMYHYRRFSAGPYFNYWDIDDSELSECDAFGLCYVEPKNTTTEFGIQARFRIF